MGDPQEGTTFQLFPDTGGKGVITQWVHGEFIVSFETIHPVNTHQVYVEYFKKVTLQFACILPTGYMVGTFTKYPLRDPVGIF